MFSSSLSLSLHLTSSARNTCNTFPPAAGGRIIASCSQNRRDGVTTPHFDAFNKHHELGGVGCQHPSPPSKAPPTAQPPAEHMTQHRAVRKASNGSQLTATVCVFRRVATVRTPPTTTTPQPPHHPRKRLCTLRDLQRRVAIEGDGREADGPSPGP